MSEIWKDIEGYEGLYQISNLGRVKSLPKTWWNGQCNITQAEKILSQTLDPKGYLKVTLCKNTIHKTHRVHRLIAFAFVPNPCNKEQVNHKNGIKTDNSINNLEWVTHQENCQHAQDCLLNKARFSKKQKEAVKLTSQKRRKLSKTQVNAIKDLRKSSGYGAIKIQNILGIPKHLIDTVIYHQGYKEAI